MPDPVLTNRFEESGPDVIRRTLKDMAPNAYVEAIEWLSQVDRKEREQAAASAAEQISLARAAKDAAFEANKLAAEANSIARAASASAKRSADAALTNNAIAIASAIMAAIAIVVSFIGLAHTGDRDDAPKTQARAQTH